MSIELYYNFLFLVFGWVLFDTNTLTDAFNYFKAMFGGTGIVGDSTALYLLMSNIVIFALCIFASTDWFTKITDKLKEKKNTIYRWAMPVVQIAVLVICTSYLVDATYNPFLYFRF